MEPAFGHLLAGVGYLVQDFVFQIEVQLQGEKISQIFVDEEVGIVAPGILSQVMFQVRNGLVVSVAAVLVGQGGQSLRRVGKALGNCDVGGGDNLVLLVPAAVNATFTYIQRAVLERDGNGTSGSIPFCFISAGEEEPFVALAVILLSVSASEPEFYGNTVGCGPVVVVKVFGCFDVILVVVGPV